MTPTKKKAPARAAAGPTLAARALHDRKSPDARFRPFLRLAGRAASDERNFVKKGVSWALRAIGGRSATLHAETLEAAQRLAASDDATERWVGTDVVRDLSSAATAKRLKARAKKARAKKATT